MRQVTCRPDVTGRSCDSTKLALAQPQEGVYVTILVGVIMVL